MSEFSRWKEYRIRQEIYVERLKQPRVSSNRDGSIGRNVELRRASLESSLQDTPVVRGNRRILNRTKKDRLSGIVLRFGVLAGGVAICLWLCWVEFGVHR
jgi:hypothetical protein